MVMKSPSLPIVYIFLALALVSALVYEVVSDDSVLYLATAFSAYSLYTAN